VVEIVFDHAGDGEPVDVDITGRHEDRDLDALVFKILGLDGFFDDDDFTIGRAGDDVIPTVENPERRPEEPDDHDEKP
jgi:hypothetical protein